ncbi:hypothetical protein [Luteibacter sp. E-22]|uniref:hypothetical protein n=1 Tax=Luteibacter sp. E-22 TaxID=3404050 RepID=UPI003CFAF458
MTNPTVVHIRQGATPAASLDHAACLLRGLRAMAGQGVEAGGMDADTCYVLGSTLDALIAVVGELDVRMARAA